MFVIVWFATRHTEEGFIDKLSSKEEPLKFLYPMAAWVYSRLPHPFGKHGADESIRRFCRLYPAQDGEVKYRCFRLQRMAVLLILLFGTVVMAFFSGQKAAKSTLLAEGYLLQRPEEGQIHTELDYQLDNGVQGRLPLNIRAPKKSGEELETFLAAVREQMEKELLGDSDVQKVSEKLHFPDEIAGFPVEWKIDTRLIRLDGTFIDEQIDPEGTVTILTGIMDYYDSEIDFQIPVRLFPAEKTKEEQEEEKIKAAISSADEDSIEDSVLPLPEEMGGSRVFWAEADNSGYSSLVLLILVGMGCLMAGMEQELKKKEKRRSRQMLTDYPDLISKLTLLLGAGMTIRGAWERVVGNYERREAPETHYAYEEMRITLHELELGVSESNAYERFGRRCAVLPYMKFSTILVQNLKKGSRNIIPLLEQEAETSSVERRELAKRLGEEAGTRLLGPMTILLLLALLIVLVPAFLSFY